MHQPWLVPSAMCVLLCAVRTQWTGSRQNPSALCHPGEDIGSCMPDCSVPKLQLTPDIPDRSNGL